jgi:hypothetical protein
VNKEKNQHLLFLCIYVCVFGRRRVRAGDTTFASPPPPAHSPNLLTVQKKKEEKTGTARNESTRSTENTATKSGI